MKEDIKKLRNLAKGTKGTYLIEYLEQKKDEVADIRSELKCKPEIEREVRLAVCDVIDSMILRLKQLAEDREQNTDEWT